MRFAILFLCFVSASTLAQRARSQEAHSHHSTEGGHNHLQHIQAYRQETAYVFNLPSPVFINGIGQSDLKIATSSEFTQKYFSQGVALLHCFWDFEAYRAFKEAIRHDSTSLMPYWGLYSAIGAIEGNDFDQDKKWALSKLKELKVKASEHEKLYAEAILLRDSGGENGKKEYQKKLEMIVHKYPEDVEAKLFLALSKMAGYDTDLNPREGQLYAEYLIRDLLRTHPENAAAHHYWIHLMENCCPEQALESSAKLPQLAFNSGHMVHMPGHIYYKLGDYKKAYDAFSAAVKVDSAYMKVQGIPEVDNWNYIHNINYLLSNCAEDGRYATALHYAEILKNMPASPERKQKFEGRFFYQGIIAPAKMELCFGFYDRAAGRLQQIPDSDSLYSTKALAYRDALLYFARGMDAAKKGKLSEAYQWSHRLDAHLWRNTTQLSSNDIINTRRLNDLNVASLELQGVIKAAEKKFDEAIGLLKKAHQKENELGYSEPPSYARPVLISLADTYQLAGQYDLAADAYTQLLAKRPHSANALWGLYKVYKKKGDIARSKEYAAQLQEVVQFGDKSLYPL
ncbi:tetratricopeptide (TPR) repeat protein [Rhabdobacter roseus]|uniref:Tetratricopeptide (TPR) repeat protein n=1 Tax=Rhabdobacter roseus TaxID=1655419 RepID=A0A840TQ13_9BACT|nr:hypothetical protein [Rhabdobacter roseus]MBB5285891.1 tetratricopeptide (TPR) repeat protein [Rhabdobacter roseus]